MIELDEKYSLLRHVILESLSNIHTETINYFNVYDNNVMYKNSILLKEYKRMLERAKDKELYYLADVQLKNLNSIKKYASKKKNSNESLVLHFVRNTNFVNVNISNINNDLITIESVDILKGCANTAFLEENFQLLNYNE